MLNSTLQAKTRDDTMNNRATIAYAVEKLSGVLKGRPVSITDPPSIDLLCSHLEEVSDAISSSLPLLNDLQDLSKSRLTSDCLRTLLIAERRRLVHGYLKDNHPHLPHTSFPYIFPLYHPSSVDIVVHWELPDQARSGYLLSTGLFLGAEHAALEDVIHDVREAKPKRNMFAETAREREEILDAIRASEWNMEMNPIVTFVSCLGTVIHDFASGCVLSNAS